MAPRARRGSVGGTADAAPGGGWHRGRGGWVAPRAAAAGGWHRGPVGGTAGWHRGVAVGPARGAGGPGHSGRHRAGKLASSHAAAPATFLLGDGVMSRSHPLLALVLAALLPAACVDSSDGADPDVVGDDKGDRGGGGGGFVEVNPARSSAAFRDEIERALRLLEQSEARIARETARSIRAGRVRLDELGDLTCWDFERVRAELTTLALTPADYARLRPGSALARAIAQEIDGYMWSDRIYVSRGQGARALAATLVHEVNHVINRSEVGYWDDLPTSAFHHEYRAFHAEALFDPEAYAGVDLVDHVLELYELDRDRMPADVLADPLTPRLVPDAEAWRLRDVASDPVDDEASCPGHVRT